MNLKSISIFAIPFYKGLCDRYLSVLETNSSSCSVDRGVNSGHPQLHTPLPVAVTVPPEAPDINDSSYVLSRLSLWCCFASSHDWFLTALASIIPAQFSNVPEHSVNYNHFNELQLINAFKGVRVGLFLSLSLLSFSVLQLIQSPHHKSNYIWNWKNILKDKNSTSVVNWKTTMWYVI